jgi:hypothetical protein
MTLPKLITNFMARKVPNELDRIADHVLAYRPKPKTKAAKRRKRRDQYAKRRRSESSI